MEKETVENESIETEELSTNAIDSEYVEPAGWKQYAGQYSSYWD